MKFERIRSALVCFGFLVGSCQGAPGGEAVGGSAGSSATGEGGVGGGDGSGGQPAPGDPAGGGSAGTLPGGKSGNATGGVAGIEGGGSMGGGGGSGSGMGGTWEPPKPGPEGKVPAFIAIGHGGRRVVSCNDGYTWLETCQTEGFPSGGCRINNSNGDHEEWSAEAIAYGDGVFLALFGWFGGDSAHILRSSDGRSWQHVFGAPDTAKGTWGTGIAFGNGAFVVNAQRSGTHRSVDEGESWTTKTFGNSNAAHRRTLVFIPYKGGRFLSYGDGGRLTYSDDAGVTWKEATTNCPYIKNMAWGNGVLVANDFKGRCATEDGLTWHVVSEWNADADVVWTGGEFLIPLASEKKAFVSADGQTWSTIKIIGGGFGPTAIGAVAVDPPRGTLVGISRQGDDFYRSSDHGRTWTQVAGQAGTNLLRVTFGYVTPTDDCKLP
ncbi:MAG: sialidase family protein [Deltaproteobacteria bacterium]|nr:sialidase family protein [Deltaproteobacteria bacterium]